MRTDDAVLSSEASGSTQKGDRPLRRATVAIVMSNYNHARYLDESLGGIRDQTRPADEIILIDDGSTDHGVQIIRKFVDDDPRVRFLRNESRLGVQGAIAIVLPLVTSDYLVWTAADDRLLPQFLERSMAALERHPQAGLCFSETTELRDGTGEIVRFAKEASVSHTFELGDLPEYLKPKDIAKRMKRAYLPIAANTVVVKRDALLALRGYPHQLEWYADSFAYTAVALLHGACVVADTLALIRATPGSYSHGMRDPARQRVVLANMLELLASPDFREVRRKFRACPSIFSPGGTLMLRAQAQRVRDWDLFVPYFWWKVREYKRGHGLTWLQMLAHLLKRTFGNRQPTALQQQLSAMRTELDTLRAQSESERRQFESERRVLAAHAQGLQADRDNLASQANQLRWEVHQLKASRDGLANRLASEHRSYESVEALIERYREMLKAAGVSTATGSSEGFSDMFAEIERADPIYAPSTFWEHYNALNLKQLAKQGLANFKLTANQNYHNFTPTSLFDAKVWRLIKLWMASPTLKPLLFTLETAYARTSKSEPFVTQQAFLGFSTLRMLTYRIFVALVWLYSRSVDKLGVLTRLEEPELGNPIRIRSGAKLVSQDLATSSREFNAIMGQIAPRRKDGSPLVVGELGAGYGRLAHVFLEMTPCRYLIVDIPPALGVAQWYLSSLFAHKKLFRFRPFKNFAEIADELADCDIAFFTPNQLAQFPERYFDLLISISSLHEMRLDQIAHHLELIARVTKEYVYLKQYRRYPNPYDAIVVERDVYRVPGAWETIIDRPEEIYADFFELMLRRMEAH